jgi:hypothetical protein
MPLDADSLLLVDGGRLDQWPQDGATRLLFGTRLPQLDGDAAFATFPEWQRGHELLRGLELSAVRGKSCRAATGPLPPAAEVLAWVGKEPFLVRSRAHRLLWFGVELSQSNLALQPALPVLCLRSLAGLTGSAGQSSLSGLLDAAESEIAARPPPAPSAPPTWFEPAREYWRWLLAAALGLFLVRWFAGRG